MMLNSNVWSLERLLQHDSSIGAFTARLISGVPSKSGASKENLRIYTTTYYSRYSVYCIWPTACLLGASKQNLGNWMLYISGIQYVYPNIHPLPVLNNII